MNKPSTKTAKFYKKAKEKGKKTQKPQKETQIFPSIPRKIPESSSFSQLILNKYFLVSFVSTFLSVAIALQGYNIVRNMQELQEAQNRRQEIQREIVYWEGVTKEYENYRDGYFRLALLEYQLGNRERAKEYIQKSLDIDPNFREGREFREKIGN